jgi:hypothetical protein
MNREEFKELFETIEAIMQERGIELIGGSLTLVAIEDSTARMYAYLYPTIPVNSQH